MIYRYTNAYPFIEGTERQNQPAINRWNLWAPTDRIRVVSHPTEFSLVGKWPLHQQNISNFYSTYIIIYIYIYLFIVFLWTTKYLLYCFSFVDYQRLPKAFCLLHCRCWKYDPKTCLTWLVGRHAIMLGDPPFKEKLLQVAALSHQILHTCLQNDGLKARRLTFTMFRLGLEAFFGQGWWNLV